MKRSPSIERAVMRMRSRPPYETSTSPTLGFGMKAAPGARVADDDVQLSILNPLQERAVRERFAGRGIAHHGKPVGAPFEFRPFDRADRNASRDNGGDADAGEHEQFFRTHISNRSKQIAGYSRRNPCVRPPKRFRIMLSRDEKPMRYGRGCARSEEH